MADTQADHDPITTQAPFTPVTAVRCGIGGVFMGLANLVPGISGGTMLLAAGVYPRFIQSIADLSALRINKQAILTTACIAGCALAAIVGLAGVVKDLVIHHRWVMYSLFIGLTLGGLPIVWRLITQAGQRQADARVWGGVVAGLIGMTALAVFQMQQASGSGENAGVIMMLIAGVAGASAMILPGVSGGYLLLVLGVYVPILSGIDTFKEALKAADINAMMAPGLTVVLPVGIGVLVGVAVVSNALKWTLARFEKQTLGVLLGLLIGAVAGLWPFQQAVAPEAGSMLKGQTVALIEKQPVFSESQAPIDPEDFPTALFSPSVGQIGGAMGLILLGYGITWLIAKVGEDKPKRPTA